MSHILVIDADKTLRGQVATALVKRGISVCDVASAQSGIASCENQLPDAIVLELQLRGHSGVEFIHELRSYTEWQKIPIVLYTLIPWEHLKRFSNSFASMDISGYAYKPEVSLSDLCNLVTDAVRK